MHAWGAFYGLTGAAAATLIGLIFIAISLRAGQYTDEYRMGTGALLPFFHVKGGPNTIGAATAALLLISIRNVWDIMVWAVQKRPQSAAEEKKE